MKIETNPAVEAAREYAESIINTVREPLIALDQDLRVVSASRSFYEVFKVNPKETVGQLIYDLGNKQWDIPKLRELLETILPQEATFDNYEVEHDFAGAAAPAAGTVETAVPPCGGGLCAPAWGRPQIIKTKRPRKNRGLRVRQGTRGC